MQGIIALFLGHDRSAVCELFGVSQNTLHQWIENFNERGIGGLLDKGHPSSTAPLEHEGQQGQGHEKRRPPAYQCRRHNRSADRAILRPGIFPHGLVCLSGLPRSCKPRDRLRAQTANFHLRQHLLAQTKVAQLGALRTGIPAALFTRFQPHRKALVGDQKRMVYRSRIERLRAAFITIGPSINLGYDQEKR